jgi:hypothetical protein
VVAAEHEVVKLTGPTEPIDLLIACVEAPMSLDSRVGCLCNDSSTERKVLLPSTTTRWGLTLAGVTSIFGL